MSRLSVSSQRQHPIHLEHYFVEWSRKGGRGEVEGLRKSRGFE